MLRSSSFVVSVVLATACGNAEPTTPRATDIPAPNASVSVTRPWGPDDRRVSTSPDPAALAMANLSATAGLCWNEGPRLVCHRLTETCEVGASMASPVADRAVRSLSSSEGHTCATMLDGSVECWGRNEDAQLGSKAAGPVALAAKAANASAGFDHSCAALINGAVQCWGDNATAQLGVPAIPDDGKTPRFLEADRSRTIRLGGPAVQVSAGGGHTCAVLANGDLRCWGDARGEKLGHTFDLAKSLTTRVPVAGPVARVFAGMWTTCALLRDGRVQCWGENEHGLLCDGGAARATPTTIPLPARAVDVALSETRACAALEDGRIACWGGVCQSRSCDLNAVAPQGACKPAIYTGGAGPARSVMVGASAICQRSEGTPPTCTCLAP